MTRSTRNLFALFTVVGVGAFCAYAQSQSELPIAPTNFRTIIAHRNAIPAVNPVASFAEGFGALPSGFSGPPYSVGPTKKPTTTVPEMEEHIAADPRNYKNLIAMITDFSQNGGLNTSKYATSANSGMTWSESFVPLSGGFPATADGHVWQANSDPVVAFDKLGNVYAENLYVDMDAFFDVTNDGVYVCVGKWASPLKFKQSNCRAVKTTLSASPDFEDKEWIAVDNSTSRFSGNVYVSWTRFTATTDYLLFSRSTNHGLTWSKPIHINPSSQDSTVQGAQVAVGPEGEVYVAWEVYLGTGAQGQHFITKSTNGGKTFGKAVPLTPVFNNLSFPASYRDNSLPALAVSPVNGFIYDVYTDQPGANSATEFVRSETPGGLTFTTPVRVNDSTDGQRLMPAVAADSNGVVHMSWFDTRNSETTNSLDIYATYTKDNGTNFAKNARVTRTKIKAMSGFDFIGDYSGIAAQPNGTKSLAHPVFTSGGLLNGQMETATLAVP